MVDPTSALNENVDEDDAPSCEICGSNLATASEQRTVARIEDGSVLAVHFCDDDCLAEWHDDPSR